MIEWIKKPYVIIGLGVGVGVCSCAFGVLKWQNKEEIVRTEGVNRVSRSVKVPKGFVGHVLGRGGVNIKSIREKSKARINFDDSDNEYTIATITGTPEAVEMAADLINEIILNRHACVTREIILEEGIMDSVWKNVKYIRQICDLSRAKIQFDFLPERNKQSPVKVTIKGKKEEVEAAVALIDEMVAKVEVNKKENTQIHMAGRALPENLPLHSNTQGIRNLPCEHLVPNSSDGFLETFISAVETPHRFWVQISGSKSVQLDKLATEMTDFYSDKRNRDRLRPDSLAAGDVIAAFFEGDRSWYRARVDDVQNGGPGDGPDHCSGEQTIRVFYLDFGDSSIINRNLVCVLKSEYLSIPFQAIECSLAGVEPIGDGWTEEVTQCFKDLVYAATWKVVMAKPVDKLFKDGDNNQNCVYKVQLCDTCTDQDIDIAKELISKGFAVAEE